MSPTYSYPHSAKGNIVDSYHGVEIADPYRWLEEPDSDETKAWGAAQNELTQSFLAELTIRERLKEKLTNLWDYHKYGVPTERNGRYFYQHNNGLQNQAVLVQQDGLDGESTPLIDPNTLSEDGTIALLNQSYNSDGSLLAYGLSQSGSDWQDVRIRDTVSGQDLPERIQWTKFTPIAWAKDSSGFFYARYPAPNEMPDAAPSTHHRVYFHTLNTPQSEDKLIYARPDAPELGFMPKVTDDGRYLILDVWEGTDRRNQLYYKDLHTDDDVVQLIDHLEAKYRFLTNDDVWFYFETDLDADRGRIIAIDVANPARSNWREIVPEQDDTIAFTAVIHNQLIIATLHHAHHKLHTYQLDGTQIGEIELPTIGSIFGLSGKRKDSEMFISFASFLYPSTIFRYDFTTGQLTPFRQPSTLR